MDEQALMAELEVVHARAIAELHIAAARFLELGERLMCTLYESRARDLVVQQDRHLRFVRNRSSGGVER